MSNEIQDPTEMIMKTLATALIALSVLTGAVASSVTAQAFSIKQLDQDHRAGHGAG